jgi:hypothetical protein
MYIHKIFPYGRRYQGCQKRIFNTAQKMQNKLGS